MNFAEQRQWDRTLEKYQLYKTHNIQESVQCLCTVFLYSIRDFKSVSNSLQLKVSMASQVQGEHLVFSNNKGSGLYQWSKYLRPSELLKTLQNILLCSPLLWEKKNLEG